jgi:hypothetical protein
MKNFFTLMMIVFGFQAAAQCPPGDVLLSSQADVDAFVSDYPDCTEISGELDIEIVDEGDMVEDLTGLINLTTINGPLNIYGLNDASIPVSLSGLENITAISSLSVGGSTGSFTEKLYLESLTPLNNIQGAMFNFRISRLSVQEELPDFDGVTSLSGIYIQFVEGLGQTPEFSGLTECALISVLDDSNNSNGFESVYIPDNLAQIAAVENGPVPQLTVAGCMNLTEIVGGASLNYVESINFADNPQLTNLSGLDQVETSPYLNISGCTEELFSILPNLSNTNKVELVVNDPEGICINYLDDLSINLGSNSGVIDTNTVDLLIAVNEVGAVDFVPNFTSLRKFSLSALNTESVSGFSDLQSVEGLGSDSDFTIGAYSCSLFPDFSNLESIGGNMNIILSLHASDVQNFEGFESLTTIGGLNVFGPGNPDGALSSFEGLESLTVVNGNIRIQNFQFLEDLSALENLETTNRIHLESLPALMELPDFVNIQDPLSFYLFETSLSELPQFSNISEMDAVWLENNPNLLSADFPGIGLFSSFRSVDNDQLTEITAADPVEVSGGLILTGNSSLNNCGSSYTICQMIETAESTDLSTNGSGCNSVSSIESICETLSTSDFREAEFKVWTDYRGHHILEIPDNVERNISVVDVQGRVILQETKLSSQGRVSLPLKNIGTGIYLVSVRTQKGILTKKVFLQ